MVLPTPLDVAQAVDGAAIKDEDIAAIRHKTMGRSFAFIIAPIWLMHLLEVRAPSWILFQAYHGARR